MMKKELHISFSLCLMFVLTTQLFSQNNPEREELSVDFEYTPKWRQTAIGLPDDPLKTLVGKEGGFYYDFVDSYCEEKGLIGPYHLFITRIGLVNPLSDGISEQTLSDPKIPIVHTQHRGE